MGQGLEQPAPRIHPLAVFVCLFYCFSVLQGGFLDIAIDDFLMLQ
jgi:hypothetical protein